MNLIEDIHSLTDFKRKTSEFLRQLKETGKPLVLTINGKAELVVQDAAILSAAFRGCRAAGDHPGVQGEHGLLFNVEEGRPDG